MKKHVLFLLICLFSFPSLFACSCVSWEDKGFCDFFGEAELVIRAKRTGSLIGTRDKMEVEILETLKGNAEKRSITIWSDGAMCGANVGQFEKGDEMILALVQIGVRINGMQPDDYMIPLCGVFHLRVKGNQVTGEIAKNTSSLSYSKFKTLMNSNQCPGELVEINVHLSSTQLTLNTQNSYFGPAQVRIFDLSGRLASKGRFEIIQDHTNQFTLSEGISGRSLYVVEVILDNGMRSLHKVFLH